MNDTPVTPEKFFSKVQKTENCWNWIGNIDTKGYGRIAPKKHRTFFAHRISYELNVGKIPEGMFIDHKCRNRRCVNPEHLRVVTPSINSTENSESIATRNRRKTYCPSGHSYSGENLFVNDRKRYCKECSRVRSLRYYWKTGRKARKIKSL